MTSSRLFYTILLFVSTQILALGQSSDKLFEPTRLLNEKAPNLSSKTIKGRIIDSNYFKSKVTLINFYSFGCSPCFEEIGLLNDIAQTLTDSNVQVISIAAASHEEMMNFITPSSKQFAKIKKRHAIDSIKYDIIAACAPDKSWLPKKPCNNIAVDYFVSAYPVTFLVDQNGIVKKVFVGYPVPRLKLYDDWIKTEISRLARHE